METPQPRNIAVDLLRGIAALCMILGHSFIVHPIDISGVPWCALLQNIIYSFHMELFFVLAGWVYKCVSYKDFVIKKFRRLLIPYYCFGFTSLLLHTFGGNLVNGTTSFLPGLVNLLFRGGGYWFIVTLFVLFLIYPPLETVVKRPGQKILLMILVLILDCFFDFPSLFMINSAVRYLPYFIFGNLIHSCEFSLKTSADSRLCANLMISLLGYLGVTMIAPSIPQLLDPILAFIRSLFFCAALYALVTVLNRGSGFVWQYLKRLLMDASHYSLQLYLFNGYLLVAARILICSVLHIHIPIVIVLGVFLCNVIVTLFVCKKIIPRSSLLRLICGL